MVGRRHAPTLARCALARARRPASLSCIATDGAPHTIFLLSPANLGGERATLLLRPEAAFPLARLVKSRAGAPLGDVFSFVSGLYFRGKATYAAAFGRPPVGLPGGLVITPGEGLRVPQERVTAARLESWAKVDVDARNERFTAPLLEHAHALAAAWGGKCRFVLLGSVADAKYVDPLLPVFGDALLFPSDFVGRGDMSRGALMLRAARSGRELPYAPVAGSARRGQRAPGVSKTAWGSRG